MTTLDAFEIIASGGCVVDIGQISAQTRRILRDRVRKGMYASFTHYGFPKPKTGYCLPHIILVAQGMAA